MVPDKKNNGGRVILGFTSEKYCHKRKAIFLKSYQLTSMFYLLFYRIDFFNSLDCYH